MPKISVIMPCLNMERYIAESLDSVLCQTLTDIEILVIDAGSTDKTINIVKRYMDVDKRIQLLISNKKSYGYQVNMGIAVSAGEYIAIVDTDDWIMPDAYEALYSIIHETGADYVKGTADLFYTIADNYIYRIHLSQFGKTEYRDGKIEVIPKEMPELLEKDSFLWYGIYKKDFMKKIRLNESPGAAYQDAGGLLQTQIMAEKAVYVDKTVYQYRQDNLNASEYNQKAFKFIRDEYDWAQQFIMEQSSDWKRVFYHKLFCHAMTRFPVMVVSGQFWQEGISAMQDIAFRLRWALNNQLIEKRNFSPADWKRLHMFMESPEKLYREMENDYKKSAEEMRTLLRIMQANMVVIFGSGRYGAFVCAVALNNLVKTIQAFCDSSPTPEKNSICGRKILTPEKAVSLYPNATYVVANKNSSMEMRKKLKELGVSEKNIYIYSSIPDIRLLRIKLL